MLSHLLVTTAPWSTLTRSDIVPVKNPEGNYRWMVAAKWLTTRTENLSAPSSNLVRSTVTFSSNPHLTLCLNF